MSGNTASDGIWLTYLPSPPALPPRPLRGWGGGAVWTGHLWFVWRLAVGRRRRPFVCFAPFGLFVSRLAPFAVSLILYPVWFVVVRAQNMFRDISNFYSFFNFVLIEKLLFFSFILLNHLFFLYYPTTVSTD